ncbi:DUF3574 domain-containing protein [Mucilaginibacter sp. HMF5004]|uniref:DUF3574 domain-containing protein n=1 Tax=Mucilaginibacter rivuli TaxID=2857527 RepID=UPI001C5EC72F|nr:DUF3574 domain-containing protein [Mucilaginibacter rivuli]MBW4890000.1 DUF3574 domain-containing protein [Mucilaginibacter rivuli]
MRFKLLFICIFLASCTTNRMVETDLYFGMNKPGGGALTDKEWSDFKEKHISAVFKEGSTVIDAAGNWKDTQTGQLITEPTHVVIYFHKPSAQVSKQIDSLRERYKKLFVQQSVLRVDKKVKAAF